MDAPSPRSGNRSGNRSGQRSGRTVASLNPTLLARKGGARPAMRSQLAVSLDDDPATALDDLGWNDLGLDAEVEAPLALGRVVTFPRDTIARPAPRGSAARRPSGSALKQGGKAAFTLRLDAERHLRLRLACTLDACSAQALVTEALDRVLAEMPEIDALAVQAAERRATRRRKS